MQCMYICVDTHLGGLILEFVLRHIRIQFELNYLPGLSDPSIVYILQILFFKSEPTQRFHTQEG